MINKRSSAEQFLMRMPFEYNPERRAGVLGHQIASPEPHRAVVESGVFELIKFFIMKITL